MNILEKLEAFVNDMKRGSIENPIPQAKAEVKIDDSFNESCLSLGKTDESCLALVDSFTGSCMGTG